MVAYCRSENITVDLFSEESTWTVSKDLVATTVVSVDIGISFIAYFMLLGLKKQ